MYAKLFIRGNTGVREGEQNLAAAVAVHTLENLLAANTAHGEKLVGLILSFPESQRNGGGPESPEPAVPTAGTWACSACSCSWIQHGARPAQHQPSLFIMSASHRPMWQSAEQGLSGNAALPNIPLVPH